MDEKEEEWHQPRAGKQDEREREREREREGESKPGDREIERAAYLICGIKASLGITYAAFTYMTPLPNR